MFGIKKKNHPVAIVVALAAAAGGAWWWRKHHPKVGDTIVANVASTAGTTVATNMVVTQVNADGSVVAYPQGASAAAAIQVPKANIVNVV